jgi:acyl-coenzyme A synthetase/AMP-(fatty) acid ligase
MNAERLLPFLRHTLSSVIVHRRGQAITAGTLLSDAAALAERLPEKTHVANLCADRYHFTVAFLAAMLRRQITLLPSNEAAAALMALTTDYPDLYFLRDDPLAGLPAERVLIYPNDLEVTRVDTVPAFPDQMPAAIFFTSGSTGTPLANPRHWGALVNSARAAGQALGLGSLDGAHILGTVPHQHSYGFESILCLALQHGLAFHGARSLLPADIVADLASLPGPRILVTTPIHLRALVDHGGGFPQVGRIICATAPLAPELASKAEARMDTQLHEIYGCSEVGQIAMRRTSQVAEWTCLAGIVLEERASDIWAAGPSAARAAPLNDVIELLGPDRFLLQGRKSDIVNIAGKRSSLSYLNHHLNAIPGVEDGVFVVPDTAGDFARLTAYVVAPTLTARQIVTALRAHLDSAFLPRPIHLVEALPRNALGKITADDLESLR